MFMTRGRQQPGSIDVDAEVHDQLVANFYGGHTAVAQMVDGRHAMMVSEPRPRQELAPCRGASSCSCMCIAPRGVLGLGAAD